MDPLVATIVMRFAERLIVVLGGCLAIYCGYRLFLAMPTRERGAGRLELPGGVSIHLSRVGPGVFFSLFGAVVLGLSFHYGVAVSLPEAAPRSQAAAQGAEPGQPDAGRRTFVGLSPLAAEAGDEQVRESERVAAETAVRRLNQAAAALDPALDPYARGDIELALRRAKLALMRAAWSRADWGDPAAFAAWVERGEPRPAPAGVEAAAAVYLAGR